jgi:RNA polymerase sigma factor for flagellar operon FliA
MRRPRPEVGRCEPYELPANEAAPAPAGPAAPIGPEDERSDGEAALWQRWCGEADGAARSSLAQRYMPYARALAAQLYARRPHDEFQFDEYQQFAMVGLMESIERYLPDRGAQFRTFATPRIRGAILNGLERLSERQQQGAFRRRVTADRVASLTPDSFCTEATQQLLEELQEIGVGVAMGLILDGMSLDLQTGLPDDAYAQIEMRQLHRQLWELVERLTDREREIVVMHYRQALSFEEIAGALRLSKGRISQLHRQAVMRLRGLFSKAERCDVAY